MSLGTLERVGLIARRSSGARATPGRSSRTTGAARASGSALGAEAGRVRRPALARRRRSIPDHDGAADAVLPPREGGRTDHRVGVHALGSRRIADRSTASPTPLRVASLFEDGATIVLQGLHRWSEPVTRFCRDLELALGHPCQVNAYITPAGAQGLDLHEDAHDVFVLQAFGRKRWELHAAPREGPRAPLDVEVAAGDTIYLPAGTPHAARAQDERLGPSHGRRPRGAMARRAHERRRPPAEELDAPVPAGWLDDPDGFARELHERLAALAGALGEVDVGTVAGERRERFLSTRAQLARGTIAERTRPSGGRRLRRRPPARLRLRAVHDAGGSRGPPRRPAPRDAGVGRAGDAADRPARGRRCARRAGSHTPLPDPASRAVLVRRLVREGLLTIRDGR